MTKLNAWSVETRAPWERNGGKNENTVRKIQMGPIDMTVSHAHSAPAAGRGRGRE